MVTLIAAVGHNRVIGLNGILPWECPEDTEFFKECTLDKAVIMGRKTFESIGNPLKDRLNIVVSRTFKEYPKLAPTIAVKSIHNGISMGQLFSSEVFIIGGGEIFTQTLPLADKILITELNYTGEGDVQFPVIAPNLWHRHLLKSGSCSISGLEYTIVEYTRFQPESTLLAA